MGKCCIIVPTYKEKLSGYEEKSFEQCLKVFGGKYNIKLVMPDSIKTEYYDKHSNLIEICLVDKKWMESIKAYSSMCCNLKFWEMFSDFKYALIYQTDCWVYEDKLDYFIGLDYDWYGAPWPQYGYSIGNGGLSLRKVKKMLEITEKYAYNKVINEDWWFCHMHGNEMNICDYKIAVNFSLETVSEKLLGLITDIPMGLHGKHLIKLWDENGDKFKDFKNNTHNLK